MIYRLPEGRRARNRRRVRVSSKSAALRWGEVREQHLLVNGPILSSEKEVRTVEKEIPTLKQFAPRFLESHARANRQKPSGIAAKEMIFLVHLVPFLGHRRLDAIKNEDVQRLKA